MIISIKDKERIAKEIAAFVHRIEELGADSVQVVATVQDKEGTAVYHNGKGNWYARQGSVEYWLRQDQNKDLSEEIAQSVRGDDGY